MKLFFFYLFRLDAMLHDDSLKKPRKDVLYPLLYPLVLLHIQILRSMLGDLRLLILTSS